MSPVGLEWVGQNTFEGGAFPLQERVPANAVEDLANGLFNEDGSFFKRGGGAYQSATGGGVTNTLGMIWSDTLPVGLRTFFSEPATGKIFALSADDSTPTQLKPTGSGFSPVGRVAVLDGIVLAAAADGSYWMWAGSRKSTDYTHTGVTCTNGSKTVTGVGTAFLANVDAGMMLGASGAGLGVGVVASVDSDTQVTLRDEWPGSTASTTRQFYASLTGAAAPGGYVLAASYLAVVANRIAVASGNRVYFSGIGSVATFAETDYHEFPSPVVGLAELNGSLLVFTTGGLWTVRNLAFDLTDALGNVQQTLELVAHDLVLWGNNGIAGVDGGLLVPVVDGVYLVTGNGVQRLERASGITKLWRQYVKAGYTVGVAAVHRGHYFLPVLDSTGTTVIDVLVLRLDSGAWSRWSGHSAGLAFTQRGPTTTTGPKLLATSGTRVLDLTGCFEPEGSNKTEADASQHNLQVTFRTVQRKTAKDLLRKVRVRYELDDAASDNPTITGEIAVGRPGTSFTSLTGSGAENVGQTPKTWNAVNKRGQEVRLRLTSSGPSSSLVFRSVEYAFRASGRQ